MQKTWEHIWISVRFGKGDRVASVKRRDGMTMFENEKLGKILEYLDTLKSEGWEVANVYPTLGGGEMYHFRRLIKFPKINLS